MKLVFYLSVVIFFGLLSCSNMSDKAESPAKNSFAEVEEKQVDEAANTTEAQQSEANTIKDNIDAGKAGNVVLKKDPQKIIKDAEISIEVADYKKAKKEIKEIVKRLNAYIGNENEENNLYKISNTIVIRIPAEKFDTITDVLVSVSKKLDFRRVNSRDITSDYYDAKSRLESKRRLEQTYAELLKKTGSMIDILQIQEKIGQIQEEIEAKEGMLKLMDDQVAYSTINLTFYELHDYKYIPERSSGFGERLLKALATGWSGFVSFILVLFYLWPLWLISFLVIFLLRRYLRKKRVKKDNQN